MRFLFIILFFISCSVEKPIQAKIIYLTVIKVEKGWVTWSDGDGLEVQTEGNFKVGEKMGFLVTK